MHVRERRGQVEPALADRLGALADDRSGYTWPPHERVQRGIVLVGDTRARGGDWIRRGDRVREGRRDRGEPEQAEARILQHADERAVRRHGCDQEQRQTRQLEGLAHRAPFFAHPMFGYKMFGDPSEDSSPSWCATYARKATSPSRTPTRRRATASSSRGARRGSGVP